MIVLFTDFGVSGPYIGQMKAVLWRLAPNSHIVDLFADAPAFNPRLAAYLLAAYVSEFPQGTVFLCVVDPGVGSSQRRPIIVNVDNRWFVGPDNGLFNVIAMRANNPQLTKWMEIIWRPQNLSNSFHGRDLFAPVAAELSNNHLPETKILDTEKCINTTWPKELYQIIYIDAYGNAMTGMRANSITPQNVVTINGMSLKWARTFSDVDKGFGFWYENANGLVEISVNQGSAKQLCNIKLGDGISIGK